MKNDILGKTVLVPILTASTILFLKNVLFQNPLLVEILQPTRDNKWLNLTWELSVFLLAVSAALFLSKEKQFSKKKLKSLLLAIQNNVESEYELHRNNVLSERFRKAVDKEAARGFELPIGSFNGAIIDLYKKEFSIFGNIIENTINSAMSNINTKGIHSQLSSLVIDMLNKQKELIKADYKRAVDGYWGGKIGDLDLNEHFANIADHETKLQTEKLLSTNHINKIIT